MRRASIFLLSVALVSSFVFINVPKTANACSCLESSPIAGWIFSRAVISGIVTDIRPSSPFTNEVEVKVLASWKSPLFGSTKIQTENNSAACGYNFEIGKAYMIYGFYDDNEPLLVARSCETKELNYAKTDIIAFTLIPLVMLAVFALIIYKVTSRIRRK